MDRIDLSKLPREEAVEKAMQLLKFERSDAEFYVAMMRGEVDGDVVEEGKKPYEGEKKPSQGGRDR